MKQTPGPLRPLWQMPFAIDKAGMPADRVLRPDLTPLATKPMRKIVKVDEEECDGCSLLVEDFKEPFVRLDYRDKFTYGYDRNSNRMYRKNELKTTLGELYHANGGANGYDSLNRLKEFRRGTLNVGNTAVTANDDRRQVFALDQIGNWAGFQDAADAGGEGNWDLDQTRTNNKANEIKGISQGSGQANWIVPAYDARGNMTSGPQPSGP